MGTIKKRVSHIFPEIPTGAVIKIWDAFPANERDQNIRTILDILDGNRLGIGPTPSRVREYPEYLTLSKGY